MPKYGSNFMLYREETDSRMTLDTRATPTLPVQIGGIVGAYLASLCIICIAIYIISRRVRNRLQMNPENFSTEVRELQFVEGLDAYGPSNLITDRMLTFTNTSPEKDGQNPCIISPPCSLQVLNDRDQSFHTRVVEANREISSRNLEDFYAHVMAQEEAKGNGTSLACLPIPKSLQKTSSSTMNIPQSEKNICEHKKMPCKTHRSSKSKIMEKVVVSSSSLLSGFKPSKVEVKPSHNLKISLPILQPKIETFGGQSERSGSHLLGHLSYNSSSRVNKNDLSTQPNSGESTSAIYENYAPSTDLQSPLSSCSQPRIHTSNFGSTQLSSYSLPLRRFESDSESKYFIPPTTKTTILERMKRSDNIDIGTPGMSRSSGLTPYSPYQPLSMTIPVTPVLITREERKQRKKLKPKTPVLELVRNEADLWDSAYD
ncbi:hypothetical protein GcM3_211014 [Golovinomyces cichoracearum]|uniref:Uncharacterized protein n=1 Tax=Golovinomyces cichoracearum TaxID=62708 RepID=A0A420H9U1_9PEZI|nr:hypothetical protein GcM3_211014 [Golovinomyces cichoracearum]